MKFNSMLLGKILTKRRNDLQISRNKLAHYIEISATELARIERGERQAPNLITLIRLCEILHIDFISLLLEVGYLDGESNCYNSKKYCAVVQNIQESSFELLAKNEELAMEKVEKLIEAEEKYGKKLPGEKNNFTNIEIEEKDEIEDESFSECVKDQEQNLCQKCKYFCPKCEECNLKE